MNIASILNFGGPDIILIVLVVLLLFGPRKLPELARGMGQAIKEFNKAKDEFERELTKPASEVAVQQPKDKQEFKPAAAPQTEPAAPPSVPETKLPS